MTNELRDLIELAETCERDDFYFEVTGEDRAIVLKALKAYAEAVEPNGFIEVNLYPEPQK